MMDATQVDDAARKALAFMMEMPDDSFGPTNAVRALPEYDSMSGDERVAVNDRLSYIIKSGDY